MPSTNIKNIPRRVNTDDDIRIMEDFDLKYGLNIRMMSSSADNVGATEGIKGNTELTIENFPTGVNTAIGSIQHSEKNDLYVFFHNSLQRHSIVRYNSITRIARIVLNNSLLKFNKAAFVSGFAVTGNNENETLLFWTDNANQPRQINVKRAERHTDGDYTDGYPNPLTEEYIRWVKYPPLSSPSIQHGEDSSVVYNNIADKVFQFRYRWRHKDGQYTAYSPISDISVSDIQVKNNAFQRTPDYVYNYIEITVDNGSYEVDKIEVCAREGNEGAWLLLKTLDNSPSTSTQTVNFYNDDTYTQTDLYDNLKNFDAVPLKARTVEYVASRAILGNAIDGYDNIAQSELDSKVTFGARYYENKDLQPVDISSSIASFDVTFTTTGLTIESGDVIIVSFTIKDAFGGSFWRYEWNAGLGDDITDFLTAADSYFTLKQKQNVICTSVDTTGNNLKINLFSTTFSIQSASGIQLKSDAGSLSFKAGAKHPLGIVYYDDAGRSCGVQKPLNNAPYVKWFNDRTDTDTSGRAVIDWRIGLTPPIWAKTYQIVYGGNSSVGEFIQYTIARAYTDINSDVLDANKSIYLCLNNFQGSAEGHGDSYITSRNPLINYQFKDGDRVRIIKTPTGTTLSDRQFETNYYDFKVLGYEYFPKSVDENPFYIAGNQARYGWTLIVEDPEAGGFSWSDLDSTPTANGWQYDMPDGTTNTALIEIYNTNSRNIDDVFYEFGEEREIIDYGTSSRVHAGAGIRNQGDNIIPKTIAAIDASEGTIEIDYAKVPPNIYVNDVLRFTVVNGNTPTGEFVVTDKYRSSSTNNWVFTLDGSLGSATISDVSTVDLNPSYLYAAGTLQNGDVWHKPRYLVTGTLGIESTSVLTTPIRTTIIETVEDYYANDFFQSNFWNKGRAHIYAPNAKQQRRKSTTWISEQIFPEDNVNGLSSFNLSNKDLPFKDYDRSFGSIQLLVRRNDELIMYQENKVSRIPVGKDSIRTGDNQEIITLSSAVLGDQITYAGDYGICENPESFAQQDGRHYFVDIKRGKAMRLSQDGLTPISDYKYSVFFDDVSKEYMSVINSSNLKIYGGFDREFGEYNITFEEIKIFRVSKTISEETTSADFLTAKVNIDDPNNVVFSIGAIQVADNVRTVVDAELFPSSDPVPTPTLEEITTSGIISVGQEDYEEGINEGELTTGIEIEGSTLISTLSFENGEISVPTTNGTLGGITISASLESTIDPKTIVFHEATNSWIGERSYIPSGYGTIGYQFFTFNDGLWKENSSSTFNNFYDEQFTSILTPVIKLNPAQICTLKSLSLEGNSAFNTTVTSELNTTNFTDARYDELEGIWYADVPMAETTTNSKNANVVGIGILLSQPSSTEKTFSTELAGLGLMIGDILYNNTGSANIGAITAIDYETNTITHATAQGGNNGIDYLYAVKEAKVDGEPIRGYAFEVRLEQSSGDDEFELYAVNGHVALSNLNIGTRK